MKPTEVLTDEHKVIKSMLKVLRNVAKRLEAGEKIEPDHLDNMVDFIREFADRCHHAKEEGLLFPAMEQAGIPKDGGPIGMMLIEHDMGRGYVKEMAEAAQAIREGRDEGKRYADNAVSYADLLAQHIDKEDNILYQMANMHFDDRKQAELLSEFDRVEKQDIGPGTHEKYHDMVHGFEQTYLKA